MPTRRDLTLTLNTGTSDQAEQPMSEAAPLRFLVLGDFSGQGTHSDLRSRRVTFDNFDVVLGSITQAFTSLDQFHPDFLVLAKPELQQLIQLRRRLKDVATRSAALEELTALQQRFSAETAPSQNPGEGEHDLLARLLGRSPATPTAGVSALPDTSPALPLAAASPGGAKAAVDRLVQHALKTTAQGNALPDRQADDLAIELLTARCQAALLAPQFRALERAWRSVYWLVTRLESDQGEVHVVDCSKAALTEHLTTHARDLDQSPLVRLLCDDPNGWDFVIGDYSFELEAQDLMLLGNLGALAARAGAPFLAHGDLSLAGCTRPDLIESPSEWAIGGGELGALVEQVRKHPAAKWVGLAAPRFLLRHPYGKRTDPIESFPFEELPQAPERDRFLWGNPAFACAWILGQAQSRGGARWPLRQLSEVGDLPMPLYKDGSGDAVQLPIEFTLHEAAQSVVEQHGLIAFAAGQSHNRISTHSVHALAAL